MPSALDGKFDAVLAAVTGPEGRIQVAPGPDGRMQVTNLPPTLPGLFDAFCGLHADTLALVSGDDRLTFAELNTWGTRVAEGLVGGFGIEKGDRVAIAMRNATAWVAAYLGVAKAGGVAVLVNGWWETDELRHALELTEPALVIADAARARRIAGTGLGLQIVEVDPALPVAEALAPILDQGTDAVLPQVTPDDDATILFTSGSTGAAKGAVSTHRAVTSGAYTYSISLATMLGILIIEDRPPANPPRTLVNVPLFHVTGEVPVMLNSFVIGRTMVLMGKWDPGEALRLIEAETVTYFVGVPTMSLEMMQHPDREKYDLSSLTDLAAGGAARPVAHVKRLQDSFAGAQPALGYGLTETNAVGCGNFWSNYADKPASTGRAQRPMVDVVILGANDEHLPSGTRGEIGIRAAANIRAYWRDPAATAALFTTDGYVRTGDIGYLDEDGYLFIVDRKKDIIIRGGENIACTEVEAAIYGHPAVSEACVFGVPCERLGEVPVAVVYSEEEIEAEMLRASLEGRLAKFKLPEQIYVSEEPLPKLGTGKIDKVALRERYSSPSLLGEGDHAKHGGGVTPSPS